VTRHLTDELSDYADRRMSGPALLAWDRHVAVCEHCRYAVATERRMLTSLRSGPPVVSAQLQAMLLALADNALTAPDSRPTLRDSAGSPGASPVRQAAVPPIPLAPNPLIALRLPTVPPSAPALHRSLRRAAALAGLAASASVAAAWAVGVAGPTQQPSLAPSARLTYPTFGTTTPEAVPAIARLTAGGRLNPLTIPAGRNGTTTPDTTERSDR
jgi:hypothetical protein